jgi:hypothetical protein
MKYTEIHKKCYFLSLLPSILYCSVQYEILYFCWTYKFKIETFCGRMQSLMHYIYVCKFSSIAIPSLLTVLLLH